MSSSISPNPRPLSDRERDWAFRLLFAQAVTDQPTEAVLSDLARCFTFSDQQWQQLQPASPYLQDPREGGIPQSLWDRIRPPVAETLAGIAIHRSRLLQAIQEASPRWRLDRMPLVDRALLILGCYELLVSRARPARRVINRTVELAKHFGEADSPRFVNGILDQIRKNRGIASD
ncbi:MAG: transcription antitermination protein NusB [Bradymonadales bacterium]|nr:transcription antitermination protein NusB [Bradymonadales bacterium]